ncbi:MAG: MarR family transcriptional regulator [Candidatus Acidiferrales bacterium]
MPKQSKSGIDYQALAEFRFEIRRFLNFSEQIARAAGLEPQQHQALLAIKGLPEHRTATVGVLAERLLIQHHSAVELVNRLETKGLTKRARGDADRRSVLLTLTRRGQRLLRQLALSHRAELKTARASLLEALTNVIERDTSGHTRLGVRQAKARTNRKRHQKQKRASSRQ